MTSDLSTRISTTRTRLRRWTRRRRRLLAAVLAGTGTLLALTSLQAPAIPVAPADTAPRVRPGEVAVPISVWPPSIVQTLHPSQVIDVVGISEAPAAARIVAHDARILELPESGGSFSTTSAAVVVVAVNESDALQLLAMSSGDTLTVLVRGSAEAG